jgi:hypothetical protein
MPSKHAVNEFLAKAAEAEAMANAATDSTLRESWLAIAGQYRALAETALASGHREAKGQQPEVE